MFYEGPDNIICYSADDYREKFNIDPNHETNEDRQKVFKTLYRDANESLAKGMDVIIDNTNVSSKDRIRTLSSLKGYDDIEVKIMATPYDKCLKSNCNRDKIVPEEAIKTMYKRFEMPSKYEPAMISNAKGVMAYSNIELIFREEQDRNFYGHYQDYYQSVIDFDQRNHHHKFPLGEHIHNVALASYRLGGDDLTVKAAYLHDCGKPFCAKQKVDKEGNLLKGWTYHNHNNVGAYKCMFYDGLTDEEKLKVGVLITYHDVLFEKDLNLEKLEKKIGTTAVSHLQVLHQADIYGMEHDLRENTHSFLVKYIKAHPKTWRDDLSRERKPCDIQL